MQTIVSVQALRAIAAIAVAIVHFNAIELMLLGTKDAIIPLYPLACGVDVFFVISGFVMVYSSRQLFETKNGYKLFLARRLCRIAPIYWISTILAINLMNLPFNFKSLLCSLFFIPSTGGDGNITPLLGVGWSLNFEIFFYCVFSLTLRFRRSIAVSCTSLILIAIVVTASLFPPSSIALRFWSDPITLEFVFGMLIAELYVRDVILPGTLRLILIAAALAVFWFNSPTMPPSGLRFVYWGLPAAALMAACVLGRHEADTGPFARFANLIGGASYAIYLLHPLVGATVLRSWSIGLNQYPITNVAALGVLVSICVSVPVYWFLERAMTKSLQRFLISRIRVPSATAAETP